MSVELGKQEILPLSDSLDKGRILRIIQFKDLIEEIFSFFERGEQSIAESVRNLKEILMRTEKTKEEQSIIQSISTKTTQTKLTQDFIHELTDHFEQLEQIGITTIEEFKCAINREIEWIREREEINMRAYAAYVPKIALDSNARIIPILKKIRDKVDNAPI